MCVCDVCCVFDAVCVCDVRHVLDAVRACVCVRAMFVFVCLFDDPVLIMCVCVCVIC